MPMLPRALLLLTILGAVPVGAEARAGVFARHAVPLADIYGSSRPMTVTAPDERTRAIARFARRRHADGPGILTIMLGGDEHEVAGGPRAELLWAPDSRAIAVTADSEADDATGRFELTLLVRRAKGRHWRQIALTRRVGTIFAPQMRCAEKEAPDVGAVGWTSAARLIVAARVPADAGCRGAGTVATYVVDTKTGDVLMALDHRTLHRRYRAMLGTALAGEARRGHHLRRPKHRSR